MSDHTELMDAAVLAHCAVGRRIRESQARIDAETERRRKRQPRDVEIPRSTMELSVSAVRADVKNFFLAKDGDGYVPRSRKS